MAFAFLNAINVFVFDSVRGRVLSSPSALRREYLLLAAPRNNQRIRFDCVISMYTFDFEGFLNMITSLRGQDAWLRHGVYPASFTLRRRPGSLLKLKR